MSKTCWICGDFECLGNANKQDNVSDCVSFQVLMDIGPFIHSAIFMECFSHSSAYFPSRNEEKSRTLARSVTWGGSRTRHDDVGGAYDGKSHLFRRRRRPKRASAALTSERQRGAARAASGESWMWTKMAVPFQSNSIMAYMLYWAYL